MQYIAQAQQKQNTINTTTPYTPPVKEKSKINSIIPISGILIISLLAIVIITWHKHKKKTKNKSKSALVASQSDTSETINNSNQKLDPNSSIANPTSNTSSSQPKSKPTIITKLKHKLKASLVFLTASKKRQRLSAIVGILMIAAVGQIVYSSFAATTEYSPIPEVAKMQKLTEEVVTMTDEYANMPDTVATKKNGNQPNEAKTVKKQELIAKVKERKDAYKLAMQYDPQTTANFYLPYTTRDKLPEDIIVELESVKIIKGTWIKQLVFNDLDNETRTINDKINVFIKGLNKTDYFVYGSDLPSLQSGTGVNVIGVVIDDAMVMTLPSTQNLRTEGSTNTSMLHNIVKPQQIHADGVIVTVDPYVAERLCVIPEVADFVTSFVEGSFYEDLAKKCHDKLGDVTGKVFCSDSQECLSDLNNPISLTGDAGKRKTLVIPINYKDDQTPPLTISELDGSYQSLATIYDDMSYGKFKPEYDVLQRWVILDSNKYNCGSTDDSPSKINDIQGKVMNKISKTARAALESDPELLKSITSGKYTDVMYVHNRIVCSDPDTGLKAGGWAAIGINRGKGYISESNILLSGVTKTKGRMWLITAMAHELGHSYGLGHAHGACNDNAPTTNPEELDLSKYCTSEFAEYADPYNIMGDGRPLTDSMSFNFANKMHLGWLSENEDSIPVPKEGGNYSINALYKPTGKRALKLKYKDKDLYIEYRPKVDKSTDRFIEGNLNPGLLAYISNGDKTTSLLGSTVREIHRGEEIEYLRSYNTAGNLNPFKIGEGDDSICVIPTNPTEEGVDVKINSGDTCNNNVASVLKTQKDKIIADNPTSYWRLDENPGTYIAKDEMGNHTGVIFGDVKVGEPGLPDGEKAFRFSESGWVNIGNQADLSTDNYTLEAWVKANQFSKTYPEPGGMIIIRNRFYGWAMVVAYDTRAFSAFMHSVGKTGGGIRSLSNALDDWHHVAIVKSSTEHILYIDGVKVDSRTDVSAKAYYISGGGLAIGRDGDCACGYYNGLIDEIAIYNKPLSIDQIRSHSVYKNINHTQLTN